MQILCTHVLLFFRFRSHEIARGGRRTPPIAVVALGPLASRTLNLAFAGAVLVRLSTDLRVSVRTHAASPSGKLHMDLDQIRNKVRAEISPLRPARGLNPPRPISGCRFAFVGGMDFPCHRGDAGLEVRRGRLWPNQARTGCPRSPFFGLFATFERPLWGASKWKSIYPARSGPF